MPRGELVSQTEYQLRTEYLSRTLGGRRRKSKDPRQNKDRGISPIGPEGTLHLGDESIRNDQQLSGI